MATWEYGPIKVKEEWGMEDWGTEYIETQYSMEYATVSDSLTVFRTVADKKTVILSIGQDGANAVAKMMAQWLVNYENEVDFIKELLE